MNRIQARFRPAFFALFAAGFLGTVRPATAAELPPDLALVPHDAAAFFHIRAADVYQADVLTDIRRLVNAAGPEALKDFQSKFAPDLSTIDRITLVMLTPQTIAQPFPSVDPESVSAVVIVRTSKPYDRLKVMQTLGSREKQYKRHVYYFNEEMWSGLVFADNQTFLIGSEDALIKYWEMMQAAKKDGALQPALEVAAGKHQLTVGINAPVLGKEEMAKFLPPPLAKLLESRCATLTLDVSKDIHSTLRLDYAKEADAAAGAKALRETLDMGRELLKKPMGEVEAVLKKNPKKAPLSDLFENLGAVLALGMLREVDTLLKDAPIQAKGPAVTLDLTYKGMQSASTATLGLLGVMAAGSSASRTFSSVATALGTGKDTHEEHLKKIAEALEKYQADKGTYPPQAITDKDGKPLHSWRVALLPYMGEEEKALFKEIKLDEPWDSLHNKKLLKKLPASLRSPSASDRFKTATQVFAGEGNVFGPKGIKKADVKPGAALLVEGNNETLVYWMKPADFTLTEGKPLPNLWGKYGYMDIHVLFANGKVKNYRKDMLDEKTIREMAKPSGASLEKIDPKDQ